MRDISTTVPKRAAARKNSHNITPEEINTIREAVAKLPGGYTVAEGQTRRRMVVVAMPTVEAAERDIEAGRLDSDFPVISFSRYPSAPFTGRHEVLVSVEWEGSNTNDLPPLRTLEGALSILPALAAQWVRA